jgi:hypothetical protein
LRTLIGAGVIRMEIGADRMCIPLYLHGRGLASRASFTSLRASESFAPRKLEGNDA